MLVLWCFVLLVVLVPWWLSGFQFWGFHSGSAIWCCLFLAGSVPNLSLYGTSAAVRPCTAADSVVSLLKAYIIRTQPCQPAEKISPPFTQLYLSFIPGYLVALKFPGVFRHARVQHHTWGFQQCGHMWSHNISQYHIVWPALETLNAASSLPGGCVWVPGLCRACARDGCEWSSSWGLLQVAEGTRSWSG